MKHRSLVVVALVFWLASGCSPAEMARPDGGTVDRLVASDEGADRARSDRQDPPEDVGADLDRADATSDVIADAGPDREPLPDAGTTTTTLRVHYPGAMNLSVRGSAGPLNWDSGVAMTREADGTFTFTTEAIDGPIEWKPLVDDVTWSRGPNYTVAPGQTVDVFPHFFADKGRVTVLVADFQSQILTRPRTVWAYLPPSYDENSAATFPVVYMHDGQNLFDPALAFGGNEWRVDETLDAASDSGAIAQPIVIGVGNTAERIYEYTPTFDPSYGGGGGEDYLRLLATELKPVVDTMLRTRPEREATVLLGSSLGGLISAHGGVKRPETFGLIGAMSPSTWWDDRVLLTTVSAVPVQGTRALRVYVDSGDSGASSDDVVNTAELAATYRQVGYQDGVDLLYVVQQGGQHSEVYWAQRLPGALEFLLGARP